MNKSRWMLALAGAISLLVGCSQVTSTPAVAAPPQNNTVYEIFVRSFADGDNDPNHIGDLKGITQHLDYLNDGNPNTHDDLGVGILWLMPIFPSPSYHGYDVDDYRSVNPDYGTLDDMKTLIREAHKRGIRVILDITFNHSSNRHEWFRKAVENEGDYRSYYRMEPDIGPDKVNYRKITDSHGNKLRYFGLFSSTMPDLNWENPRVRQEMRDVARYWLDMGIDGFRLDAAKHLAGDTFKPNDDDIRKNNIWWREFSDYVYANYPKAILVGEVLGSRAEIVKEAHGLSSFVDEPFMNETRTQVISPKDGYLARWKDFVAAGQAQHPPHPFNPFPYLASHDRSPRLATDLADKSPATADAAYRQAMCILLTVGKYPMLYYGDEIAQQGRKWNGAPTTADKPGDGSRIWDETLREPFPWYAANTGPGQTAWQPKGHPGFLPKFDKPNDGVSVEEQHRDPASILSLVRALQNLRNQLPVLSEGDVGEIIADTSHWMVFEKVLKDQRCLVVVNLGPQPEGYRFHPGWHAEYANAQILFTSDGAGKSWKNQLAHPEKISETVQVPAFGMVILRPAK